MSPHERIIEAGTHCARIAAVDESVAVVDSQLYYRAVHRAISRAVRHVLLSGWQFDTQVHLLRGADAEDVSAPVQLLPLLEWLCTVQPSVHVYLLAWDFNVVFALEREWFQAHRFGNADSDRIHFQWDRYLSENASHHQKMLVVDGLVAFCGGMDICESRWDSRDHTAENPLRCNADGKACKPYHDVQAGVTGSAVETLQEIFCDRWMRNSGETLRLQPVDAPPFALADLTGEGSLPLRFPAVAISQTRVPPGTDPTDATAIREIQRLYVDLVSAAEVLIYIENQYFTSRALLRAFEKRLEDKTRQKLQIVIVMPQGGDTPKEKLALGTAQSFVLRGIQAAAEANGHSFRAFFTGESDQNGETWPTFIHSKVLIVDDRVVTIGSANLTNRSFGLDSELNLSWESGTPHADIENLRASLLGEHTGIAVDSWRAIADLTERLDAAVQQEEARLHRLDIGEADSFDPLLSLLTDPVAPLDSTVLDERLDEAWEGLNVSWFRDWLDR